MKFKVGDWCFCEFELQVIERIENSNIRQVSTGFGSLSSSSLDDRCFPLTKENKLISDEFEYFSKKLHEIKVNINMPDIHRWLVEEWVRTCARGTDKDFVGSQYKKLNNFYQDILRGVRDLANVSVDGVRVIR